MMVSKLERLFLGIFERQNRIERQLHEQLEYFESLDYIADCRQPPSCPWKIAPNAIRVEPGEKEDVPLSARGTGNGIRFLKVKDRNNRKTSADEIAILTDIAEKSLSKKTLTSEKENVALSARGPDNGINFLEVKDCNNRKTPVDEIAFIPDIAEKSLSKKTLTSGDEDNNTVPFKSHNMKFHEKENVALSARGPDNGTSFLEVKDCNNRKTPVDEIAIIPDITEKSLSKKTLTSGDEDNNTVPFKSHNMKFHEKENVALSARGPNNGTSFLEVKDFNNRKTPVDEIAIIPDIAEKSLSKKSLTSGDEENNTVPFKSHNMKFREKENMALSARGPDNGTNFLEVKDCNNRKTHVDEIAIIPDIEKYLSKKTLTSGDEENNTVAFKSDNMKFHGKGFNSYSSGGAYSINEAKQTVKASDCEYENSWPKMKKMKYKSCNIIATTPRPRVGPFLDINQQSECIHKTINVSEAAAIQPSKFSLTLQNNTSHIMEDYSDFNTKVHDLVIDSNEHKKISVLQEEEEYPNVPSKDEVVPRDLMPSESEIHHTSPDTELTFSYVDTSDNKASEGLGHHDRSDEPDDALKCLYDITTISDIATVMSNYDEIVPEFGQINIGLPFTLEDNVAYNYVDLPKIAKERALAIKQLIRSTPSEMNKERIVLDGFHSLPLGITDKVDLGFSLEPNSPDLKHPTTGFNTNVMDMWCNIGSPLGPTLERSHSLCSSAWFTSETKSLPLTPIRKFSHGRLSRERSSSSMKSSNPELKCYPIDENFSTAEGNADFVQVPTISRIVEVSSSSKPLSDVSALCQNDTDFLPNFKQFVVRDSLESVKSESASSLGFDYVGRESTMVIKKNFKHTNSIIKPQRVTRTVNKLSKKSKLSCTSSESTGNYQNLRKGGKLANVVSNISSFVPQTLQRQGAPPLQGTKGRKVKALETAEAVKRLEEQKKIEREKRKEATKLEREKIKQQNANLLNLKQKQKEEERRKKEEDVAARKRQREQEERKVKERKRQCIEETRIPPRERANNVLYGKGEKDIPHKDENKNKRELRTNKAQNNLERAGSTKGTQMVSEVQHHILGNDKIQALGSSELHDTYEKGVGCSNVLQEEGKETFSATQLSLDLQSYEMSPYLNSDDEDMEDSCHKKKHIPMWARRESLSETILSIQHLDPKAIFSRKKSFNVAQVLSTHTRRRQPLM